MDNPYLTEYETVVDEKLGQQRKSEAASTFLFTSALGALAYAASEPEVNLPWVWSLVPLSIFVVLHAAYVYRRCLWLKADSYITVFLEPHLPGLRWHSRKFDYGSGAIRSVYHFGVGLLFVGADAISLAVLWHEAPTLAAGIATTAAILVVVLICWSSMSDRVYRSYVDRWRKKLADEQGR